MILILSKDGDVSTDKVIEWLKHMGEKCFRLNDNDLVNKKILIYFNKKKQYLKIDNKKIDFKTIKVVWFRKFGFFNSTEIYRYFNERKSQQSTAILNNLSRDYDSIKQLILLFLKDKIWLANYSAIANLNKIDVLIKALNLNIEVPQTIILNSIHEIDKKFLSKSLITKSLSQGIRISSDSGNNYSMLSSRITKTEIDNLAPMFFPSLLQQEIIKLYEIRTFYLAGKFNSMAIFSQQNKKTEVDFRNYDNIKPNRTVPYKLPKEVEKKLDLLMRELNLNTGSIDLIKSQNDKYIFLEVNPCGQFGMVEDPCNYNIHKDIALHLKKMEKNGKISH